MNELIMMVNPSKKKQKEVVKPKEEKVVESKGKGKGKGRRGDQGDVRWHVLHSAFALWISGGA